MTYTVEQYAQAVWERSVRVLSPSTAPDPDGSYIDSIQRAVWEAASRTTTGGGTTNEEFVFDNFVAPALVLSDTSLTLDYVFAFDHLELAPLSFELPYIDTDYIIFENLELSPLYLGDAAIFVEDPMAVTLSNGGAVYKLTAASDTIAKDIIVTRIRWVGAVTLADALEVRGEPYAASDTIFASVAQVANFSDEIDFGSAPLRLSGLRVQTMASGTLYVYVR